MTAVAAAAAAVGLALCPAVAMTTRQTCVVMPTPPQVPTLLPPLPLLLLIDWLLTGRLHLPAVRTATMSNLTPGGHWTAEGQSDLDESRPQLLLLLLLLLLQHLTHWGHLLQHLTRCQLLLLPAHVSHAFWDGWGHNLQHLTRCQLLLHAFCLIDPACIYAFCNGGGHVNGESD